MPSDLVTRIVESISSGKGRLIQGFRFGKEKEKENELLFFFKPECFTVAETGYTESILEMTTSKLAQYDVCISGALLLPGERLEALRIMDRHYGYINELSRMASEMLNEEELTKIQESLGSAGMEGHIVLGGHEFLQAFDAFDAETLNELWMTKKSVKLRSGFYCQQYDVRGQKVVLVNGFHPYQLGHFTDPSHSIVLLLLHSDTHWRVLKHDLVGDTFPERAKADSIRGELFKNSQRYGVGKVSISYNFVHLSAGPFEALFEIHNFLKDVHSVSFELNATNMHRLMEQRGLGEKDVKRCLSNPVTQLKGSETDLFTYTEDKNSSVAITDYLEHFG